ncbi:MAG: hypothetical protein VX113_07480, partial [Pseudomonadota bacterium]|nr:hypothetical protein [Pseudomonadota bacterium]
QALHFLNTFSPALMSPAPAGAATISAALMAMAPAEIFNALIIGQILMDIMARNSLYREIEQATT